jgi:hypothetical protein
LQEAIEEPLRIYFKELLDQVAFDDIKKAKEGRTF